MSGPHGNDEYRTAPHPPMPMNPIGQASSCVILVDEHDRQVGFEEKLAAHQRGGQWHRAFSVFLFHHDGRMLLQRRARHKYHFRLLWSNACCSHPVPGRELIETARERLQSEVGVDAQLVELFTFRYEATDPDTGLTEKEHDHVLAGVTSDRPALIEQEAEALHWVTRAELRSAMVDRPDLFTPWLRACLPEVLRLAPARLNLPETEGPLDLPAI